MTLLYIWFGVAHVIYGAWVTYWLVRWVQRWWNTYPAWQYRVGNEVTECISSSNPNLPDKYRIRARKVFHGQRYYALKDAVTEKIWPWALEDDLQPVCGQP